MVGPLKVCMHVYNLGKNAYLLVCPKKNIVEVPLYKLLKKIFMLEI